MVISEGNIICKGHEGDSGVLPDTGDYLDMNIVNDDIEIEVETEQRDVCVTIHQANHKIYALYHI